MAIASRIQIGDDKRQLIIFDQVASDGKAIMNMYVYDFSRFPIVAIEVKYSWVACVLRTGSLLEA